MTSYLDHYSRLIPHPIVHSWTTDLGQRLRWLYGDHLGRMRSPASVLDLTAWHFLGKPKPPVFEPPEAA